MAREVKNNNSIFSYAFIGSLLFIAAFAYTLAYLSNIVMLELSYTAMATVLSVSSVSLLYKAAKNDRDRVKEI
ncbi:MAG: hypothetical protein K0Q79_976 [Flavipsychrobacter sp.]|jgi:hypothetical protein|nr:hypothetical protein [Flavipsychrobacter sp.]